MNRFDQYRQAQQVRQFNPTPLDTNLIMGALGQKQQSFDSAVSGIGSFAPELSAYTGDLDEGKQYITDAYETHKSKLLEDLSETGDVSKAARELQVLHNNYLKDTQSGKLAYFANRKAEDEANLKQINTIKNPADKMLAMQDYLTRRHTQLEDGKYSSLNTPILLEDPGVASKVQSAVKMAAESSFPIDGGVVEMDPETGQFKLGVTNEDGTLQWSFINAEETAALVAQHLAGDSEVTDYMSARDQLGAPIYEDVLHMIESASQLHARDKFTGKGGSVSGSNRTGTKSKNKIISSAGESNTLGKQYWSGSFESSVNDLTEIINDPNISHDDKVKASLQLAQLQTIQEDFDNTEQGAKLKAAYEQSLSSHENESFNNFNYDPNGDIIDEMAESGFVTHPAIVIPYALRNMIASLYGDTFENSNVPSKVITETLLNTPSTNITEVMDKMSLLENIIEEVPIENINLRRLLNSHLKGLNKEFKKQYPELYQNYTNYNNQLKERIKDKDILFSTTRYTMSDSSARDATLEAIRPLISSVNIEESGTVITKIADDATLDNSLEEQELNEEEMVRAVNAISTFDLKDLVIEYSPNTGPMISMIMDSGDKDKENYKVTMTMDNLSEILSADKFDTVQGYVFNEFAKLEGGEELKQLFETHNMLSLQEKQYAPGLNVADSFGIENKNVQYTKEKGISVDGKKLTYNDLGMALDYIYDKTEEVPQKLYETIEMMNNNSKLKSNDFVELDKIIDNKVAPIQIALILDEIAPFINDVNLTEARSDFFTKSMDDFYSDNSSNTKINQKIRIPNEVSSNVELNEVVRKSRQSAGLPLTGNELPVTGLSKEKEKFSRMAYDAAGNAVHNFAKQHPDVITNPDVLSMLALVQTSLETEYGKSGHVTTAKNLFGIKGDSSWSGKVMSSTTSEVEGGKTVKYEGTGKTYNSRQKAIADGANTKTIFRAYDDITDSFHDWINFLFENPKYKKVLKASNLETAIEEIRKAGYATATHYVPALKSIAKNKFGFPLS